MKKKKLMANQIYFKTCEKKALTCPGGLSGQCFCSSLSQASKEQNPVIAIFHTFHLMCTLQLKSHPLAQSNPGCYWYKASSNTQNRKQTHGKQQTTTADRHPTVFTCSTKLPKGVLEQGTSSHCDRRRCSAASTATPCQCSPGTPHLSLLPFLPEKRPKLLWKYVNITWSIDKSIPNKIRWTPPLCYAVYYAKSSSRSHCAFEVYILRLNKRRKKKWKRSWYFLADTELHRQDREKWQGADR